jgi:F-type H+-transporting ATPase subunit b
MITINFTLIIQVASFLFVMFVLKKLFFDPLTRIMDKRDSDVKGANERAGRLEKETQESQRAYTRQILDSKREGIELEAKMESGAILDRARIVGARRGEHSEQIRKLREELDGQIQAEEAEIEDRVQSCAEVIVERIMSG